MKEIVPPRTRSISPTKILLDGVMRGHEYRVSQRLPEAPRSPISPKMIRARRQLDVVLLRERRHQSRFSWLRSFWRRLMLPRRIQISLRRFFRKIGRFLPEPGNLSPKKALYASLVAGVSFGMISMSILQEWSANDVQAGDQSKKVAVAEPSTNDDTQLVRELSQDMKYEPNDDLFLQFFNESEKEEYRKQISELVRGYPIEAMLPYILDKDRVVAAFLIGIAKKESNWGKHIPVLDGQDCFNYWGYRGVRRLMGTGGHTCFNSRKDAVDTVAQRIESLVYSSKLDTPAKMIIWKCGYSCDGHSRESVRKWIADVDTYFEQLNDGGDKDQK